MLKGVLLLATIFLGCAAAGYAIGLAIAPDDAGLGVPMYAGWGGIAGAIVGAIICAVVWVNTDVDQPPEN